MTVIAIVCGKCGAPLRGASPSDSSDQRKPCTSCGSLARKYLKDVEETLTPRGGLALKARHPGRRPFFERKEGPSHSVSRGKLVHREQDFDHEGDRYREKVADYETGEVIHETDETLSGHVGHGDDKKNRNK